MCNLYPRRGLVSFHVQKFCKSALIETKVERESNPKESDGFIRPMGGRECLPGPDPEDAQPRLLSHSLRNEEREREGDEMVD